MMIAGSNIDRLTDACVEYCVRNLLALETVHNALEMKRRCANREGFINAIACAAMGV